MGNLFRRVSLGNSPEGYIPEDGPGARQKGGTRREYKPGKKFDTFVYFPILLLDKISKND